MHAGPAGYGELAEQLRHAVEAAREWMAGYGDFAPHPSLDVPPERLQRATSELRERLRDNYPFFHPRYVGQMLKPPHPAAMFGYTDHFGHLTSSGTIANLEALFVACQLHPGKAIAHSADAH